MFVTNTGKLHKGLVLGAEGALQRGAALLLQDGGDGAANDRRRGDLRINLVFLMHTFPSFTMSSNSFNPLSGFDEIKPQATYKNRSDFRHCSIKDKVS